MTRRIKDGKEHPYLLKHRRKPPSLRRQRLDRNDLLMKLGAANFQIGLALAAEAGTTGEHARDGEAADARVVQTFGGAS